MSTYSVSATGDEFVSFSAAIKSANALNSNVILISDGSVKWSPAPKVSAKRMRQYYERQNAYAAQLKLNQS